jgi:cation transport regulator ChaC
VQRFETGKPLKVINCAELVSKYVGETGKNIEYVFKEARTLDAILVPRPCPPHIAQQPPPPPTRLC